MLHPISIRRGQNRYIKCLEKHEDDSVDWYFDREFSKLKDLADYQRLVPSTRTDRMIGFYVLPQAGSM